MPKRRARVRNRGRGKMPVAAKKRVGMAGYVSPQPLTPVTKRTKTAVDVVLLQRALKKLPDSKRAQKAQNRDQAQHA